MASFLHNYREYTKGTEAHPTYHTFSALVALSSIISRRVWVDMGHFKVFPNLYVVLVGPAGNRKTSAMTPAKNLIRELKLPFSAECVTKEKLVLDLQAQETIVASMPEIYKDFKVYTPMTIMVTELSEFLGAGGIGMINFLTTIYDQDYYDIRTKNKGDTSIKGPYLTLLACTTPDWITTYLRQDVISGGFSRRAIFVYETDKAGRIAFPEITPEMHTAWQSMVSDAKHLLTLRGPMSWDPAAKKFFSDWYINLKMPTDPTIVGYYETKHMQLIKVATLIALSETGDLCLRTEHLEFGLELLRMAEVKLARVFVGIGRNELNGVAIKVLSIVESGDTIDVVQNGEKKTYRGLLEKRVIAAAYSLANMQELQQVLNHLITSGKLKRIAIPGSQLPYLIAL